MADLTPGEVVAWRVSAYGDITEKIPKMQVVTSLPMPRTAVASLAVFRQRRRGLDCQWAGFYHSTYLFLDLLDISRHKNDETRRQIGSHIFYLYLLM